MKVVLITGAGSGLGAGIAEAVAAEGYAVAINYRSGASSADALVSQIKAKGGQAVAIHADVSDEKEVKRLFDRATAELGPITGLINNAGGGRPVRIEDLTRAAYDTILNANLATTMLCSAEAVRRMSTARGGSGGVIVNISTMGAPAGGIPGSVVYAAAKSGVDALTLGLAREVAAVGIRVCAIRPGMVATPRQMSKPAAVREDLVSRVPMGRMATEQEIANAVLFLLSEKSTYNTATIMNMGGGLR